MKKNYTEIAFVLDRSGSMSGCQEAAIAGFNQFLLEQQEAEGLARLTLVLFDDEYLVTVQSLPVQEVVPLNWETFVPRGSTALLDAAGKTIADLGARLGHTFIVDNRPGADGSIGTESVMKANPDGYTLIVLAAAYAMNPAGRQLPYDPRNAGEFLIGLSPGTTRVSANPKASTRKRRVAGASA